MVTQIVFTNNGSQRMPTTKSYDNLKRLTSIATVGVGVGTLDSHTYAYNSANQHTALTITGSHR